MATKKDLERAREHARLLFMQGEPQKVIAEKVGVSAQTITKWVNDFGWAEQRAATNISRPQLVNKLLATCDRMIEEANASDDPAVRAGLADKLAKFGATIERLDKKTSVVDMIETAMAFSKWLQFRMSFDPTITPELFKTITNYLDMFINEQVANSIK